MATGAFFVFKAKGTQRGKACDNQFIYYSETDIPGMTGPIMATAWVAQVWTAVWKTLVTTNFTLDEVACAAYQSDQVNNVATYTRVVNETGDLDEQTLAPSTTIQLVWQPDNDEVYPIDVDPFGNGRSGFSGIPEAAQDDGLVTDDAILDWNSLGVAIREVTFTVAAVDHDLPLCLTRQPQPSAVPPILYDYGEQPRVPIMNSYTAQKTGRNGNRH